MKNKKYKNSDGGVYQIRNIINDKVYIGSTNSFARRKDEHFTLLRGGKQVNPHLQYAYNMYGESAFVFEILEIVSDENMLIKTEQKWFDNINPCDENIGYNILNEATDVKRVPMSEETKIKISNSRKGTPAWNKGLKCPQWSGEKHGMHGKTHTPEVKQRLREFHLGTKLSEETKRRMSEAQRKIGKKPPIHYGKDHALSKPVICLMDNRVFDSITDCSKFYGVCHATVRRHCEGKVKDTIIIKYKYVKKEV